MQIQKATVQFHFLFPIPALRNRTDLKAFIRTVFQQENTPLQALHFIFCSDDYLYKLNIDYLQHNTYTDIITFPLSEVNAPVISDIYISADRVKENAKQLHIPFTTELHRVIFHGALHLCGYKDKSPIEKTQMREKENFYLNQYLRST